MDRYKQIEQLYNYEPLKRNARKLVNNRYIWEDLYNEVFKYLLELDDDKFNKINDLKAFSFTVMWAKANAQSRTYTLKGKDNVLFEMCNQFSDVSDINQVNTGYDVNVDIKFNNVIKAIEQDKNINDTDVYILFESVDRPLSEVSRELDVHYYTLRKRKSKLINRIKGKLNGCD